MRDNGDVECEVHGVVDKVSDSHAGDPCFHCLGGR